MVSSESDSDSGLPDPDNSNNSELTISNDEIMLFTDDDEELDAQELVQFNQYQPLPMEESQDSVQESSDDETVQVNENVSIPSNLNIPPIVPVEDTLVKEVWSRAPASDIEMDSQKVDEVKQVMANITLPASAIPEWAAKIPEENWKQELMERLERIKKN